MVATTLKERVRDIPELVLHFLTTRQVGPRPFQVAPEVLEAFARYEWPGNVRELVNVLERAQILAENQTITLDDLPENMLEGDLTVPTSLGDSRTLRAVECRHLQEILRQENGNKVHAARALGISRRALYRLIQKYRLADES